MAIDPIQLADVIKEKFERYLLTTFKVAANYPDLAGQLEREIKKPGRLFRGPYLQGLSPYRMGESIHELINKGVLPDSIKTFPFLSDVKQPLYQHQSKAIRLLRANKNVVVASGTGSGKTFCFLIPILAQILENPGPGIHAMMLYPMNALVQDQLKVLRSLLKDYPNIRFGRYVNINVTPELEKDARRLHPEALPNEVVSREVFRTDPPHILITNFSMLEYLLLRATDSPLFHGPWRVVALDEAHTYTGAKGSEVSLLMRRLVARIKDPTDDPPQFVATSATIGASDPAKKQLVAEFAQKLFNVPFEDSVVEAEIEDLAITGGVTPNEGLYSDPVLADSCESKVWADDLSQLLENAGFESELVHSAMETAESDFEVALYRVFEKDTRIKKLRSAVGLVPDLEAAAFEVFGRRDGNAVRALVGLVRVASLAEYPHTDARLVPCRYHFFVRGLSGGYIAFDQQNEEGQPSPSLFLDPMRRTPDGSYVTTELYLCRKCGQPFIFAYQLQNEGAHFLVPFGSEGENRGKPVWLAWIRPRTISEDEEDEIEQVSSAGQKLTYCPQCGAYDFGETCECKCGSDSANVQMPLWLLKEGSCPTTCLACGGRNTITSLHAMSDAAQTAVAESFYKYLPEAKNDEALYYPGRGRKLLCFSDSRQGAAYFAPYLQDTHERQKIRWLLANALVQAGVDSTLVTVNTLANFMVHLAEKEKLFPWEWEQDEVRRQCLIAFIVEFCLPIGRRQSLEALGLASVSVDLSDWYQFPELDSQLDLTKGDQISLVQFMLSTLRMQKIVTLPPPLSANLEEFTPKVGLDAAVAKDSDHGKGFRLNGFVPTAGVTRQRRSYFLKRVFDISGNATSADKIRDALYQIWTSLTDFNGPSQKAPLKQVEVAPGKRGYQIRWESLRFHSPGYWYYCSSCSQWSATNVLGICPSFQCSGHLTQEAPDVRLRENHYRAIYRSTEHPVPLVAKEHTAQISPTLATIYQRAFQEGHSKDEGQINILSCSTTFELGVDLGDLEAVFLRDVPPSPTNYQQRAGRAGRGVGTAAFVVTFALPRSHDEYYFSTPEEMVCGDISPPRISLTNEVIARRHMHSVLLSDFVRSYPHGELRYISSFLESNGPQSAPIEELLDKLEELIARNRSTLETLKPEGLPDSYLDQLAQDTRQSLCAARDHYFDEKAMFENAIKEAKKRRNKAERENNFSSRISQFIDYLGRRLKEIGRVDWVTFFSSRAVLPRYAFPIYNVILETSDSELKLDRDLRIALSEYAPGAKIVAKGKLWESVGIRRPTNRTLPGQWYARCPNCWYVQRHLDSSKLFKGGNCPVCEHPGRKPPRRKHFYMVPEHGFTTDLQEGGKNISFDRPMRISSSRVLFIPQQDLEDPVILSMGDPQCSVSLRTTDMADFFVFNDGDDGSGRGFLICKKCGLKVDEVTRQKPHKRPYGGECQGTPNWVHLGHEFRGSAARIVFEGTGHEYNDHGFWLSLMYAILGGMAEALDIERNDIDGIIRAQRSDSSVIQEVVLFDNVPGGAGHVKRLSSQDEFLAVLESAHRRSAYCSCGSDASCYRCLRVYGNFYCHDILERGLVADFLDRLSIQVTATPDDDMRYVHADSATALKSVLESSVELILVADELTTTGPAELGPWHILLQSTAARLGTNFLFAVRNNAQTVSSGLPLLMLKQAGARILRTKADAGDPPYALLGVGIDGERVAFHWGAAKTTTLDSTTHRRELWQNRSNKHLKTVQRELLNWVDSNTEELSILDLVESGYTTQALKEGDKVSFDKIFASKLEKGINKVVLQDPYLRNGHQLECLADLLAAISPYVDSGSVTSFWLTTKISDQNTDRFALSPPTQRAKIEEMFERFPEWDLKLSFRPIRDSIHARFLFMRGPGANEVLFYLDRGLDMVHPKTGLAHGGTILEFQQPARELKELFEID